VASRSSALKLVGRYADPLLVSNPLNKEEGEYEYMSEGGKEGMNRLT
jgi:hypothetical protein